MQNINTAVDYITKWMSTVQTISTVDRMGANTSTMLHCSTSDKLHTFCSIHTKRPNEFCRRIFPKLSYTYVCIAERLMENKLRDVLLMQILKKSKFMSKRLAKKSPSTILKLNP